MKSDQELWLKSEHFLYDAECQIFQSKSRRVLAPASPNCFARQRRFKSKRLRQEKPVKTISL